MLAVRNKIVLKKIISEIDTVAEFLGDTTLENFLANEELKHATAMTAIIFGELVKDLTPEFRIKNSQVAWKKFAGLSDFIACGYEFIKMEDFYNTIKKDFPEFKAQIEKILETEPKVQKMLTIDEIKKTVAEIAPKYNLKKVTLFGSLANGIAKENSDVDLLVEFDTEAVSLLKLISLKHKLEDIWNLNVDVIHAPISEESILIIEKEVEIYAA